MLRFILSLVCFLPLIARANLTTHVDLNQVCDPTKMENDQRIPLIFIFNAFDIPNTADYALDRVEDPATSTNLRLTREAWIREYQEDISRLAKRPESAAELAWVQKLYDERGVRKEWFAFTLELLASSGSKDGHPFRTGVKFHASEGQLELSVVASDNTQAKTVEDFKALASKPQFTVDLSLAQANFRDTLKQNYEGSDIFEAANGDLVVSTKDVSHATDIRLLASALVPVSCPGGPVPVRVQ